MFLILSLKTTIYNCRVLLFLLLCLNGPVFSQEPDFKIEIPAEKIQHSAYNTIKFLDSRRDTVSMGLVQVGLLNRREKVMAREPFRDQISNVFKGLTDSSASAEVFVFQLRELNFQEMTKATKEIGSCYLNAKVYREIENNYIELGVLDTLITVSAMEVTKRLFRETGKVITQFISGNLNKTLSAHTAFSYAEVVSMDSVERSKTPLYTTSQYTDGLYINYASFKLQKPDYPQVVCSFKGNVLTQVQAKDSEGRGVKLKESYALVYKGLPYVLPDEGIYPIKKDGHTFSFTGRSVAEFMKNYYPVPAMMFGLAGAMIAQKSAGTGYFDFKIDFLSGAFIPYRAIDRKELKLRMKTGEIPKKTFDETDGY